MALDTFHLFARLPAEIRDQIWDMAALSVARHHSAHFFTFCNLKKDGSAISLNDTVSHEPDSSYCLAAPRCGRSRQFSWVDSNPSAYMSEIGLWGACSESRDRIQKHLRPLDRDAWVEAFCACKTIEDIERLSLLKAFYCDKQSQHFTVYLRTDLFCLQPFNFDTIRWRDIPRTLSIIIGGPVKVGHVALEFDPAWDELPMIPEPCYSETGPLRCIATAASFEMDWASHLWFIDYRIRRRSGAVPGGKRQTFYGSSCRYVEVRDKDEGWDIPAVANIFRFLRGLDDSLENFYCKKFAWEGPPGSSCTRYRTPDIGVLACETTCSNPY